MNDPRGSVWRKWDLHVHTPASIVHHFGNQEDVWEKFLKDLESLPSEFKVLGINDYMFLDGYERLLREKRENYRLENIDLLLPVIEFRIEKFAGVDFGSFKRMNLHVIFSEEVSVENIKSQFLNTLDQSYVLNDGQEWNRAITKESISDLGRSIKENIPAEELENYGSDLIEGFNNLNVKEEQIFKALKRDCFIGKNLIAIGKTEWDSLRWSDASIATKKSIINKADIVFTAVDNIKFIKEHDEFDFKEIQSLWQFMGFHLTLSLQKCMQGAKQSGTRRKKQSKNNCVLVFDHQHREQNNFTDLILNPPVWSMTYYDKVKHQRDLAKIIDVPHFVDSKHVE
ncbi:hypothetical protein [Gracilimonas halophila]|uniref:Uncharacterized protein n=1 Tax=Gracilimonas halophila TaxID=1834464 RepID=A0ABW5JIG0_9BACT